MFIVTGILGLFAVVFGLALFAFWIWMIVDVIQNPRLVGNDKIVWALVVIFLHALGAAIYFFVGRQRSV